MSQFVLRLAQAVAVAGTLAGIGYYCLSIFSGLKYLRERSRGQSSPSSLSFRPPVTILKPLKGTDPQMYESFRSHCLQDYSEYEIIFGVSDADDPAIALVKQLQAEFPSHHIRLMTCSEILGTNVKVSNLVQMAREAKYEHLIVNDSDIRVEPDYLQRVIAPLSDPRVGLVTALYRGVPAPTIGSHLEAIGISTDFSAGVLSADGGFEPLLDYLADDYELGARIASQGLEIRLADCVVDTFLPAYSFRSFLSHQLRWARAVRDSRPWGYFGLILTLGVPWAILTLLLAGGRNWAWLLVAATLLVRVAMAEVVGRSVLRDLRVTRSLFLLPVRDVIFAFVWLASYAGHRIHWRGADFYLRNGRLVRTPD
jgi:ceramide glucosyltransferase